MYSIGHKVLLQDKSQSPIQERKLLKQSLGIADVD